MTMKHLAAKTLLALAAVLGSALGQVSGPPVSLTLTGVLPPAPAGLSAGAVGTTGFSTYCYIVVANYPGGSVPSNTSVCVTNGNATLTGTNKVVIAWQGQIGVSTYDVIKFLSPGPFPVSGSCTSCSVTTGITATTVSDTGAGLGNYTLAGFTGAPVSTTLKIDNILFATPTIVFTPALPFQFGPSGGPSTVNLTAINDTNGKTLLQFPVPPVTTPVNFFTLGNSATGNAVPFGAGGTDTNVGINYRTKGTGTHFFNSTTLLNGVGIQPTGAGVAPLITSSITGGETNAGLRISTNGTGTLGFFTQNGNNRALRILDTAGAPINNLTIISALTTADPVIGIDTTTDADVGITLTPKGSGTIKVPTAAPGTSTTQAASTAFVAAAAAVTAAFSSLTSGTNGIAAMVVGTGASLTVSGSGTINATSLAGTTAAAVKVRTCEVVIGGVGTGSVVLADDNDQPVICVNATGATETITAVSCYADAGTPTVTPIITGGAANSILTGALTCGTAAYAAGTLNGTPTETNGQTIDFNITTAGGVAKMVVIRIVKTL